MSVGTCLQKRIRPRRRRFGGLVVLGLQFLARPKFAPRDVTGAAHPHLHILRHLLIPLCALSARSRSRTRPSYLPGFTTSLLSHLVRLVCAPLRLRSPWCKAVSLHIACLRSRSRQHTMAHLIVENRPGLRYGECDLSHPSASEPRPGPYDCCPFARAVVRQFACRCFPRAALDGTCEYCGRMWGAFPV